MKRPFDLTTSSAGGVAMAQSALQQAGGGSSPTPALHDIVVKPVEFTVLKRLFSRHHYLHSASGGHRLGFGVFAGGQLSGGMAFNGGPLMAHRLVRGIKPDEMVALCRLWLSDDLPKNTESRVIAIALRALRKRTTLKAVVSYADPAAGHIGIIYQATGWLYTGLSDAMPRFDIGDGVPRHSRSLSSVYGTHSVEFISANGVPIKTIQQSNKHRYLFLLDPALRGRLTVPVLPYPKMEDSDARG